MASKTVKIAIDIENPEHAPALNWLVKGELEHAYPDIENEMAVYECSVDLARHFLAADSRIKLIRSDAPIALTVIDGRGMQTHRKAYVQKRVLRKRRIEDDKNGDEQWESYYDWIEASEDDGKNIVGKEDGGNSKTDILRDFLEQFKAKGIVDEYDKIIAEMRAKFDRKSGAFSKEEFAEVCKRLRERIAQ